MRVRVRIDADGEGNGECKGEGECECNTLVYASSPDSYPLPVRTTTPPVALAMRSKTAGSRAASIRQAGGVGHDAEVGLGVGLAERVRYLARQPQVLRQVNVLDMVGRV